MMKIFVIGDSEISVAIYTSGEEREKAVAVKKEKKKKAKEQKERRRTDKQEGRKLARLEIISAVIYEALLAFQLCISGRGNKLTARRRTQIVRYRYYVFYVSNANLLIPDENYGEQLIRIFSYR